MFVIETENMSVGGLVEYEKNYRLRHLTSHYYLALGSNINEVEGVVNRRLKLEKDVKNAGLFKFELIYSTLTA